MCVLCVKKESVEGKCTRVAPRCRLREPPITPYLAKQTKASTPTCCFLGTNKDYVREIDQKLIVFTHTPQRSECRMPTWCLRVCVCVLCVLPAGNVDGPAPWTLPREHQVVAIPSANRSSHRPDTTAVSTATSVHRCVHSRFHSRFHSRVHSRVHCRVHSGDRCPQPSGRHHAVHPPGLVQHRQPGVPALKPSVPAVLKGIGEQ